jgi:hypothetical protein
MVAKGEDVIGAKGEDVIGATSTTSMIIIIFYILDLRDFDR